MAPGREVGLWLGWSVNLQVGRIYRARRLGAAGTIWANEPSDPTWPRNVYRAFRMSCRSVQSSVARQGAIPWTAPSAHLSVDHEAQRPCVGSGSSQRRVELRRLDSLVAGTEEQDGPSPKNRRGRTSAGADGGRRPR